MGANFDAMRKARKVLAEFEYEPVTLDRGYANRWLYVNVGTREFRTEPVTQQMKDLFTGGKGFDLWIMWHMVTEKTRWDSPENVICISGGPLCGTTTFAGAGKALVTSISPTTGIPIDSNVGGHAGPFLKVAGFDALCLQGKAERDVVLFLDARNHRITLEEAPLDPVDSVECAHTYHRMYAEHDDDFQHISVISSGRAAEHTLIGCLNFSFWDQRRREPRLKQAGRGGIGTVFRNKKIKAVVLRVDECRPTWTITQD